MFARSTNDTWNSRCSCFPFLFDCATMFLLLLWRRNFNPEVVRAQAPKIKFDGPTRPAMIRQPTLIESATAPPAFRRINDFLSPQQPFSFV
jgi:hypothetical protein